MGRRGPTRSLVGPGRSAWQSWVLTVPPAPPAPAPRPRCGANPAGRRALGHESGVFGMTLTLVSGIGSYGLAFLPVRLGIQVPFGSDDPESFVVGFS